MNSIKKNYVYNVIYQILAVIIPLITAPYLSRTLGVIATGKYSYATSIAHYFVILIMLGLNNYGNKSIAKVRDNQDELNKTFTEIYSMQLLTGFVMLSFFVIFQIFSVFNFTDCVWFELPYVISAIIDLNWLFFGLEEFKLTVSRNIFIKILSTIAIFLFVKSPADLWLYILISSLSIFFSNFILLFFLPRRVKFVKVSKKNILKHVKENLILFIPVIATSIYTIMDKIMIEGLSNVEQLGYYEYSEKIKNIPLGFINAFGIVMLPRMSNIFSKDKSNNQAKEYINTSMTFVLWLSIAISFGIASISNNFIPLFLGNNYNECILLTAYMSISIIFISWANVIRTQYLIPKSLNRVYVMSSIIGAAINIIFNAILIPYYGAGGAVVGTILAEFGVALYQSIKVRNDLNIISYLKVGFLYLLFGGLMFAVNYMLIDRLFISNIISLVLKILTGTLVYILLSYLFDNNSSSFSVRQYVNNSIFKINK